MTEASWLVRDAVVARDAAPCLEIYAPLVEKTAISFEERPPSLEEWRERIRASLRSHSWLVLEDDGAVVGYAYATRHRERACYRWATDTSVYVASAYRGRRAGTRLYGELLARLKARGFHVACAGITLPNEASVGLHRSLGFEPIGTYRRIGFKLGSWHDVLWMQRELTEPVGDPRDPD